jgi:hypothetical protein
MAMEGPAPATAYAGVAGTMRNARPKRNTPAANVGILTREVCLYLVGSPKIALSPRLDAPVSRRRVET